MPPSFSFLFIFGHQIISNFSLLVPQSKPHVHPSPLLVHRHGTALLDLHLAVDHRIRPPHLRTTSQEICCTTQLTQWLVHKLKPRRESRWQSLITNLNHKGTYQPYVHKHVIMRVATCNEDFGPFRYMCALNLNSNNLSGVLPSTLQMSKQLVFLDLAYNQFYGHLTAWFGDKLSSLALLWLRSNKFSGNIPIQLARFQGLQFMDSLAVTEQF